MLCRTYGAMCVGLNVVRITVEVSITQGVGIYLVGLPDSAVRESLLRVTTALQSHNFRIPGKKTVINLAPADLKKEGTGYDVAIAVTLLTASNQISFFNPQDYLIFGEIGLDGTLRPVKGVLPIAMFAKDKGYKACIFPKASSGEARFVNGIKIYGANNLMEVVDIINGEKYIDSLLIKGIDKSTFSFESENLSNIGRKNEEGEVFSEFDFRDVKEQDFAKRGLEIAASGGHNVILVGSPGSGKSFMAKCLPSILPPMTREESLETSMIYSIAGEYSDNKELIITRPFRTPHHTCSQISLIGGGQKCRPGEISLAHNGVLYLDEMTQYPRYMLDSLRQPLEDRKISISRAKYKVEYPASFMLVGSMNPCPCGYAGEDDEKCNCTPPMISRYWSKISGPLLDRIDLQIRVRRVNSKSLTEETKAESSRKIAERVREARYIQYKRLGITNAQMTPVQMEKYCVLGLDEKRFMKKIIDKFNLSARSYSRVLKLSRTIADLSKSKNITVQHISEAVQYRF